MQSERHPQRLSLPNHLSYFEWDGTERALESPMFCPVEICKSLRSSLNSGHDVKPFRIDNWSQHEQHRLCYCLIGCFHSACHQDWKAKHLRGGAIRSEMCTNPRMNPTIDITAAVRPYANRLVSHAVGSGKVSINQSWNTGGNLYTIDQRPFASEVDRHTNIGNIFLRNISAASLSTACLILVKVSLISLLCRSC